MEQHPSETELERYANGVLSAGDLLRIDDHLAVCAHCRRRAAQAADVSGRIAGTVSAIKQALTVETRPVRRRAVRAGGWLAGLAAAAALVIVADIVWGTRSTPPAAEPPSAKVARVSTDRLTPSEHAAVEAAIQTGELSRAPELAQLNPRSGVLMGSQAQTFAFGPTFPVGVVVDADRPTLEWSPADGASEYQASVFDENFNMIATSGWQKATHWTVDHPLPRGTSYVWQVTARVHGGEVVAPVPPQPESRFKVTSIEQSAQLAELRKRAGDSHLALAVLLAEAGVLDEAERELTIARSANPESSAVRRVQENLAALRR